MTQPNKPKLAQVILDSHWRMRGLLRQFNTLQQKADAFGEDVRLEILTEVERHVRDQEKNFYPELVAELENLEKIGGAKWAAERALVDQAVADLSRLKELCEFSRRPGQQPSQVIAFRALLASCDEILVSEEMEIIPILTKISPQGFDKPSGLSFAVKRHHEGGTYDSTGSN